MTDTLAIEHEIQRQMIERLHIEWTPGEPFYALVEDEINRLRLAYDTLAYHSLQSLGDENAQLREMLQAHGPYCPLHGEHQPCSQHRWVRESEPC